MLVYSLFSGKPETVGTVHEKALKQLKTEVEKLKEFFDAQLERKSTPKKL